MDNNGPFETFVFGKSLLTFGLLLLGILATILNDNPGSVLSMPSSPEAPVYFAALILRVFGFAVLFLSFSHMARLMEGRTARVWQAALSWFVVSLGLMLLTWWMLARYGGHYDYAIKRFLPDGAMASFADGWTLAEVALGKGFEAYTWTNAIAVEAIAIAVICMGVAIFNGRFPKKAAFSPLVAFVLLVVYAALVPWAFVNSFDFFIGDGLLGTTLLNAGTLPWTILYGGFTAPAVWINLLAMVNVYCVQSWSEAH